MHDAPPNDAPRQERVGLLTMNPKGFGFVRVGDGIPDIFIPASQTGGALQGERVQVRYTTDEQGRNLGEITAVLDPLVPAFVARWHVSERGAQVLPLDPRWPKLIAVRQAPPGVQENDLVHARLVTRPCGHVRAEADVEEVFGPVLSTAVASTLAIFKHALPTDFPADVLAEAAAIPAQPTAADRTGREDCTAWPWVTIDGETSRDFDDAVCAEPVEGGWRLHVAIADVAHYVRPGTALDEEAQRRTTSVYLPDRVLPMLPEALSNGVCSLNPGEDRLCMLVDMVVATDGTVRATRMANAVMRSQARLTYTEVALALEARDPATRDRLAAVLPSLDALAALYTAMAQARHDRGALEFESAELRFSEAAGQMQAEVTPTRNLAHRLIEECMIAANVAVAERLFEENHPAPYRVHTLHSPERHADFQAWAQEHGWTLPAFADTQARDVRTLLQGAEGHPMHGALVAQIRRLQGSAIYATANGGHFGLALGSYTHFTSPIRRYPDLWVHRALKDVLAGRDAGGDLVHHAHLALQCTEGERRAVAAERTVQDYLRTRYLAQHLNEEFDGVVSAHAAMGVFVTFGPSATSMLGPAHLAEATYDSARRLWIQADGTPLWPPGTALRVRLIEAKIDQARVIIVPV
jgi:ribonuclease R